MAYPLPQIFDHTIDMVKGWIPGNMGSLDHHAKLSANVTVNPVYEGRVVHLNSAGEFELGHSGTQMPIFLLQNSYDNDVVAVSDNGSVSVNTVGIMSGVVATGGYEIASTEFNDNLTYAYNDPIKATASNSNATTGGVLTNAAVTIGGATPSSICGIVSKPPYANQDGKRVLTFWSYFLPGSVGA